MPAALNVIEFGLHITVSVALIVASWLTTVMFIVFVKSHPVVLLCTVNVTTKAPDAV